MYDYADDKTISCTGDGIHEVRDKMLNILNVMITWFTMTMTMTMNLFFQFVQVVYINTIYEYINQ